MFFVVLQHAKDERHMGGRRFVTMFRSCCNNIAEGVQRLLGTSVVDQEQGVLERSKSRLDDKMRRVQAS